MPAPGEPASVPVQDGRVRALVVMFDVEAGAPNATAPGQSEALETCIRLTGAGTEIAWAPEDWIAERKLEEAFPMWDPGPSGRVVMDVSKGRKAGQRPVERRSPRRWRVARGLPVMGRARRAGG
jgi:hypothetical protein